MADAGLVVGWKEARTGRETQAMELFVSTMSYYAKEAKERNIESFEPVLLNAHGGDLGGFILIRGSQDQVDTFRNSDDFRAFLLKAIYCLEGVGVVNAYLGDGLQQVMGEWGTLLSKQ